MSTVPRNEIKPGADLNAADLRNADLRNADLRGINLRNANLRYADLRNADLRGINLRNANLRNANLRGADLRNANLRGTNLCSANLCSANLCGTNLRGTDLRSADLRGADLRDTSIDRKTIFPFFQIPQTGSLEVWKKVEGGFILKLLISDGTARTASVVGRKCRAAKALTLEVYDRPSFPTKSVLSRRRMITDLSKIYHGTHDYSITYCVGKETLPDHYDDNPLIECTNGIHFFLTREEAEEF